MTNITERYDDRTTTDDQLAKLTPAIIDDLKAKGHTQSDIARMYDVTRQHVSWVKLTYGGRLTPREIVLREHWPWSVSEQQSQSSPYRRMRDPRGLVRHWRHRCVCGQAQEAGRIPQTAT